MQDAGKYGAIKAKVFSSFGGAAMPNPRICSYTWMCHNPPGIHPTDQGYAVIAQALERAVGY
jgi:lysophospholipase L1-like esterase